MSVMLKLGQELMKLQKTKVVVHLRTVTPASVTGTLFTAQEDYLMLIDVDARPAPTYIPFAAIAYVRLYAAAGTPP